MSTKSKIEWTELTWNPVTGCTKVSPGCKNCYAEKMAKRLKAMGSPNYKNGFNLTCHEHLLKQPISWKKSQMVFVNSMSDLFHESVPDAFIIRVFETMNYSNNHCFQILTKRSDRLQKISSLLKWSKNIWMGVSVENAEYLHRIDDLIETNAFVKFISFEPLLGPIPSVDLSGVDWAIVGGESGPKARPMEKSWVLDIKNECEKARIPFFFKQWGGINKKKTGRILDGKTWDEMPFYETSSNGCGYSAFLH
ncbi:MAG: phage Gp37/Gp68 family protein [Proteobacteria bacterium]|nr:phage Gp37/Gp68 family protein [Pseudomonadota bacterium]